VSFDNSQEIFSAPEREFPDFLMPTPSSSPLQQGVIDLDSGDIPPSISLAPSSSHPPLPPLPEPIPA